jgi:hypothetical protein
MGLSGSTPEPPRPPPSRLQRVAGPALQPRFRAPEPQPEVKKETPKPLFSWDDVKTFISSSLLAPKVEEDDDEKHDSSNECPICFLNFRELNVVNCCKQAICTGCYIDVRNGSSTNTSDLDSSSGLIQSALYSTFGMNSIASSSSILASLSQCPFCNKTGFQAKYTPHRVDNDIASSSDVGNTAYQTHNSSSGLLRSPSSATSRHDKTSGTPGSTHSSSSATVHVPLASLDDRKELEKKIHEQHVGYNSSNNVPASYDGGVYTRSDSWNHSGQRSRNSNRSTYRSRNLSETNSFSPSELDNMSLEELRALRLMSSVRHSMNVHSNSRSRPNSRGSSPRSTASGSSSPNYHRTQQQLRREQEYNDHMLMGANGLGDMEDMLLQAALAESMKEEYQGTSGRAQVVEAMNNESDSESDSSASSHSMNKEINADDDISSLMNDPSLSEEERIQLAMALSLSVQSSKKDARKRKESEVEDTLTSELTVGAMEVSPSVVSTTKIGKESEEKQSSVVMTAKGDDDAMDTSLPPVPPVVNRVKTSHSPSDNGNSINMCATSASADHAVLHSSPASLASRLQQPVFTPPLLPPTPSFESSKKDD